MFLKSVGLLPLLIGGFYVAGVFGGGGGSYARDIARPPAEVMEALADLDIREQPGSPGTDASRSGGVEPVFRVEREGDRMVWTVMSGDKVAIRMIAVVEAAEEGRHSHVTAYVERGDAPDEFVSPAFRSTGITMGLFGSALDDELGELTRVAAADPALCDKLLARFEMENMAVGLGSDPNSLGQAIGNTAKMAMKLREQEAELRRVGCETDRPARGDAWPTDEMSKGGMSGAPAPVQPVAADLDPTKIDPSVTEIPADLR